MSVACKVPNTSRVISGDRKKAYLGALISCFVLMNQAAMIAKADSIVDDATPGWTWTQGAEYADPSLYHGSAHALPAGAEGTFTFSGTGVEVFTMTGPEVTLDGHGHRLGKLNVILDGKSQKEVSQLRPSVAYDSRSYMISGLVDGNHVIELRAEDGWIVVDYLKLHTAPSPSADASGSPSATSVPSGFVDVSFYIHNCFPSNNQQVILIGSVPALGNWQANHAAVLTYTGNTPDPTWAVTVRLPAGIRIQYKYGLWNGWQTVWEAAQNQQADNHDVDLPEGGRVTCIDGDFKPGIKN